MKKFLDKYSSFLLMVGIIAFIICMTTIAISGRLGPVAIINATELERQANLNLTLDRVVTVLIEELDEEREKREVCEAMVDRWAADARTRQEVKNEVKRLRKKAKKKGVKK